MVNNDGPWPECTSFPAVMTMTVRGSSTHGLYKGEMLFIARRREQRQALGMHGDSYRTVCCLQSTATDSAMFCQCQDKFILLNLIEYFTVHLADFHKDWPEWHSRMWTGDHDEWFQHDGLWATMPSTFPGVIAVIAYAGQWLWARIHGDLMSAHGGGPDDFSVTFGWEPQLLNTVWPYVPGFAPSELEGVVNESA